jgi:hypothetical protein
MFLWNSIVHNVVINYRARIASLDSRLAFLQLKNEEQISWPAKIAESVHAIASL